MNIQCPICVQDATKEVYKPGFDGYKIFCPRCGRFIIERSFYETLKSQDITYIGNKYILSGIIRNRTEEGLNTEIYTYSLEQLKQSVVIPEGPFDIIDLLLEHILKKVEKITNKMYFNLNYDYPLLYQEKKSDLKYYIRKAEELKYIEIVSPGEEKIAIRLNLEGWKRLEEKRKTSTKSNHAFVAMWFDKSLDSIYENGFKVALEETGYKPIRIDLEEHNEKICDKIIAEIRKSGLLIADFTEQRGGVYFEAGFALGCGIPVIWTCRENDVEKLHFDTRQYNHIVWEDSEDLKIKLINRIEATISRKDR